jgi:mono/diheme cytochrome c family protein
LTNVINSGSESETTPAILSGRKGGLRGRVRTLLLGLLLVVALAAMACSQGTYPLDIFYEMHYQQSYKVQEPPNIAAVASAVAWYPGPVSTSFGTDGKYLFEVNCSMCHGQTGKGDGPVLELLTGGDYGYQPVLSPDLTGEGVMAMGPAGIEGFMRGGVNVMPNFSKLLTQEEMTAISEYIAETLQK